LLPSAQNVFVSTSEVQVLKKKMFKLNFFRNKTN
jgi:hypothetical protein